MGLCFMLKRFQRIQKLLCTGKCYPFFISFFRCARGGSMLSLGKCTEGNRLCQAPRYSDPSYNISPQTACQIPCCLCHYFQWNSLSNLTKALLTFIFISILLSYLQNVLLNHTRVQGRYLNSEIFNECLMEIVLSRHPLT